MALQKFHQFPKRKHDEFITPEHAAVPLRPFIKDVRTFAEPCCAPQKQLVGLIESWGPLCIHADDIQFGTDALTDPVLRRLIVDAIITNPPYTWAVLRAMLELFPTIAPTWLLLEATFKHSVQGAPYMRFCSDVVSVGQVKWVEGSKHRSIPRYAWYRFGTVECQTIFHPRQDIPRPTRAAKPSVKAA